MSQPSISRRNVLRASAIAAAAAAGSGLAAAPAAGHGDHGGPGGHGHGDEPERLALVNGRIHTLDGHDRVVSSVLIEHGRFTAVGHGVPSHGPGLRVINLRGRTVVPGVIESHIHSVSLANRPGYHTILENTTLIAEVQEALAARRRDVPEGAWITSMGGFHTNQWTEHRLPTRAELDEAVPDRPVLLYTRFTGPCATNTLGKQFFDEIDAGPLPHPDAVKIRVGEDGSIATGGFGVPTPSTTALYLLRTMQTYEDKLRSTRDAMAYSASVGLTAHLDQVLFPTPGPLHPSQVLSNLDHYRMYDPWLDLHRRGETIIRLQMNFLHNQSDPALPELNERLRNQFQFFGDDMLMTGSIGEWAAPLGAGEVWFEAQRLVARARWRNENSVQNLAGLQQVVEAYEAVNAEFGITDLRWMVHHVPFVTTDLLDRLQALGCGVSMAAFRWVDAGPGASGVGAPFRTIVDHGIKAGIHGDGVHIAPLNPWPHLQYAVTGRNSFGDQVNAGQQLTRTEALRAFTLENAWFLRMEDRLGSIERGKLADLVVLDRDYFSVPEDQIRRIRSELTIVDGRIVHDTGRLTGRPR
ncbi:MAG TPA: amidohydrolase family protein [Natronosporangium sp.]